MPTRLISGGSWSVYWYNGMIVSSEIARGLDIYELMPSGLITQNEIDAAKTVQVRLPQRAGAAEVRVAAEFRDGARVSGSARAIERVDGREDHATRDGLAAAEKLSGNARQQALKGLAAQVTKDASSAGDQAKARMLATAITELEKSLTGNFSRSAAL